jgi:iron complex outermembrane receptor protein
MSRGTVLVLFASCALVPGISWAQAAGAPVLPPARPSPATQPGDAVSEVVVTAQRRSERLLDVPISITVIGGPAAVAAGVVNTRDLALVTPGLVGGQTGYVFQPSIRGISSTGTGAGDEANVATYVDNVYIAAGGVTAFNLANIDHIEILKGPQGTLFGRNATGGAIRVVTSNPSFDPQMNATISGGVTKPFSREVSVYGTGKIAENLAGSLAGYYYDDNGYLKNADPNFAGPRQGSLTSYIVRGKLLYTPTDRLKIVVEGDYGQSKSGVELTTTFAGNVNGFKNVVGVLPALGDREVSTNEQNYLKGLSWGAYVNVEYRLDDFTLSSITAVRTGNVGESLDSDRTNLPLNRTVFKADVKTFSQEFNITTNFTGPFNFIAGAYYFHEEASNPFISTNAALLSPVVGGVRTITRPLQLATSIFDSLKTNSYSAFGEATYRFNEKLSVVGGLRYSVDYKSADSFNLLVANSPPVDDSNHWGNVSYRATVNYKPTPDSLIYLTNSTGFKSGNINAPSYPFPNHHDQVSPETVTAYEIGYKARLFEGVDFSASAFHYDYKNIQLTVNNALSAAVGTVGINILQNAAVAKITGADFELTGRINAHWSGQLGVSWLPQAEYSNFQGGIHFTPAPGGLGAVAVATDLSGTRTLRSPEATLNAGLNYQTVLAGGKLRVSGNYFRTGTTYLAIGQAIKQPGYDILGGEVGWTDPSGRYTLSAWGRNLGDTAYFISGNANTGGFGAVWSKPREVGLRLRVEY